jgi:hypothetical protein
MNQKYDDFSLNVLIVASAATSQLSIGIVVLRTLVTRRLLCSTSFTYCTVVYSIFHTLQQQKRGKKNGKYIELKIKIATPAAPVSIQPPLTFYIFAISGFEEHWE